MVLLHLRQAPWPWCSCGRPHLVMRVTLTPGKGRMAQERSTMAWLWPPPTSTRSFSTGEGPGGGRAPGSRDCSAPMLTFCVPLGEPYMYLYRYMYMYV